MKRGSSALSHIIGIRKETGMTSHDVVNCCRRIFSERRVGHAGTLDPSACGVLLICVGPATRINPFLTSQEKSYRFKVCFGSATDTDDAEGIVIDRKSIPQELSDYNFAQAEVVQLIGRSEQMPPAYSAIKVGGKRSYEAARVGSLLQLTLRDIEIFEAKLLAIEEDCDHQLSWEIIARVSKGTYIRSIARDLGKKLGTCAHVTELERIASGSVVLNNCVSLSQLEKSPDAGIIDPVPLLGFKVVSLTKDQEDMVKNGNAFRIDSLVFSEARKTLSCNASGHDTTDILINDYGLKDKELFSVVTDNKLLAIYRYDLQTYMLKPQCVFSIGVSRGLDY